MLSEIDAPRFNDLPLSYRMSQHGMLTAITTVLFSWSFLGKNWPDLVKLGLIVAVIGFVFFALCLSAYVVLRYPYLSLVDTRDGDVFKRQFKSRFLSRVTKLLGLGVVGLLFFAVVVAGLSDGIKNPGQAVLTIYVSLLFAFLLFLCFRHSDQRYPAVSTFIRSTLGLGIVLAPLFIPILILGNWRCNRLLDAEVRRQQQLWSPAFELLSIRRTDLGLLSRELHKSKKVHRTPAN